MSFNFGLFRKALVCVSLWFAGATTTHAQSACAVVYKNAVANVSTSTRETTEISYVFNLYCETSGETKEWVSSASASFPIKGIPISASGDGDFTQNELKEFCEIGSEQNYAFGAEFGYNRDIAVDALQSFNQCVALERKVGLTLTHEAAPPKSIVINGQFAGVTTVGTLDAVVYDKNLVACTSANFNDDGQPQTLNGAMALPIGAKQFSITCERNPESLEDGQYYPYATVQVSTSFGVYTVVMPSDKLHGFKTAAAAEAANAEMTSRFLKAESERLGHENRVNELHGVVRSHRILSVYYGDGGWQGNRDVYQPCGGGSVASDEFMENVCVRNGLKYSGWKFIGDHGGGVCGHSWYAVMCYEGVE